MGNIYFFRGKAATGKTLLTNMLGKCLNIPVFRKDDFYDTLFAFNFEHGQLNDMSYKLLKKIIQTNIDVGSDFIVDAALPHKPYIKGFLNDIEFKHSKVFNFLCVCTDDEIWKVRMSQRLENPTPNQSFESVEWVMNHYLAFDISALNDEFVLDSKENLEDIFRNVINIISTVK